MRHWLIAHWTLLSDVHIADWDETSAFCNVPRGCCGTLLGPDAPGLDAWLPSFYDQLRVQVVTPHGLTDSYQLRHGGAQGDSMGVGTHEAVGTRRTEFPLGVLRAGLFPSDLTSGAPNLHAVCFPAPHDSTTYIPELVYSDDRRFFSRTAAGLAHILDIACHGCWASGGAVNFSKLKVFHIRRRGTKLQYITGTLSSMQGDLPFEPKGLAFVGIPLLQGEAPTATLHKATTRLERIHRAILRHRPAYILALRVILSYGVAVLDTVADALPFPATSLVPLQRRLDTALTAALCVPNTVPKALLYAPLHSGGFGVPHLSARLALRYLHGVLRAASSRNALLSNTIQHLLARPLQLGPCPNDADHFHSLCALHQLQLIVPPSPSVQPAQDILTHLRPYSGGPVLLISDGSAPHAPCPNIAPPGAPLFAVSLLSKQSFPFPCVPTLPFFFYHTFPPSESPPPLLLHFPLR